MNRRKFLIAVGAVSVATYFAGMPAPTQASLPMNRQRYMDAWYTKLYPWQQHLWTMLQNGKEVMYVTSTQQNAWRVFNVFRRHPKLHCVPIGSAICGKAADLIIVDDFEPHPRIKPGSRVYDTWFDSCIRTRLYPNGKIVWART